MTGGHFSPIPVIISAVRAPWWLSSPFVSIYIFIVSASPTAWRHESVVCYQLGPHKTRNNLCWLQSGQSQNSNYAGTSPSDLCHVTSRRPRPVPRTASRRDSAGRRCLAWAGWAYGEIRGLARQLRLVKTLPSQHFCAQLLLISTNSSDSSCDGIQFQKLAYVFEWLHIIKASSKIGDRKLPSSEGEIEKMLLNWCLFAHGRDSMEIHLTTFTFRWKEERNKRLCLHYGE